MSATPQIEDAEVSRFRQYLKIKTVSGCDDPKPDYGENRKKCGLARVIIIINSNFPRLFQTTCV